MPDHDEIQRVVFTLDTIRTRNPAGAGFLGRVIRRLARESTQAPWTTNTEPPPDIWRDQQFATRVLRASRAYERARSAAERRAAVDRAMQAFHDYVGRPSTDPPQT